MTRPGEATIVGRVEARERLEQLALASALGRRTAVLVSGEAGMGKTSLIRAAFDTTADGSTLIGWGTCWQSAGAPGFWPWMQAFDDLDPGHRQGQQRRAAAGDDRVGSPP